MKYRRVILYIFLITVLLALSACQSPKESTKQNTQQGSSQIATQSTTQTAIQVTTPSAKVDMNWIAADMGGLAAPKFTITSKQAVANGSKITFSEMAASDASLLISTLASGGYTINPTTNYTATQYTYFATNSQGFRYEFIYNLAEKNGTLTYLNTKGGGSGQTTVGTTSTTKEVIKNTAEWDTVKMGGLPAPSGMQLDQMVQGLGWTAYYSKCDQSAISAYISISKSSGYTKNTRMENTPETDYYYGYTEKGNELYILYNKKERAGYMTVLVVKG